MAASWVAACQTPPSLADFAQPVPAGPQETFFAVWATQEGLNAAID